MRADILCIREHGHVYPFYFDRISEQPDTNRLGRGLCKQGKNGLHRIPLLDNSEDTHKSSRADRFLPPGKLLFSAVHLFLIRYGK